MVRNIRGLKIARGQRTAKQLRHDSKSKIRSNIDFLNLRDLKKEGKPSLGRILEKSRQGTAQEQKQKV